MPRPRRFDWLFRPHVADEDLPLSAEARFAEALSELPPVERSALALSEIGGLNEDEIAERLGTEPAVVRKVLSRARASVRTALDGSGRRGLTALLPLQTWWQTGASAPAVRAAGVVAAAVVGTGVAIGGASAEAPLPPLTSPDPPTAHTVARADSEWTGPLGGVAAAGRRATSAPAERASVTVTQSPTRAAKPSAGRRENPDPAAVPAPSRVPAPEASVPVTQRPSRGEPSEDTPAAPPARPTATERVETVARTLPQLPPPAPEPVVEPPVTAPVPVPAPELPPLTLPAPPTPPLPGLPPPLP